MVEKQQIPAYVGSKALVIDDDKDSRELLSYFLNELGISDIVEISSGHDALAFLDNNKKWRGIVLCDWNMPKMSGASVYRQVRNTHPDIPFIMVTGRNDEDSILFAKDSGIYAYILKPFPLQELERKISKVVQNHAAFLSAPANQDSAAPYTI